MPQLTMNSEALKRFCDHAHRKALMVSRFEGLNPPTFSCVAGTSSKLAEYIKNQVAEFELKYPGHVARVESAYKALGLLSKDEKYLEAMTRASEGVTMLLFDPRRNEIMLVLDNLVKPGTTVQVDALTNHEVMHAIQRRNFDSFMVSAENSLDASGERSTARAFYEGDAAYTDIKFRSGGNAQVNYESLKKVLLGMEHDINTRPLNGFSRFFFRQLALGYSAGLEYAYQNRSRLNELRRNPPKTSAELLHPGKVVKVETPKFAVGEKPAMKIMLGEAFVRHYLSEWLSPLQASDAASGWVGDELRSFGESGSRVHWAIRFESPKTANTFTDTIVEAWTKRFREAPKAHEGRTTVWEKDGRRSKIISTERQVDIEVVPTSGSRNGKR